MIYRKNFDLSIYFIADSSVCAGRAVEDVVAAAVKGGATMVQLRNKICTREIVADEARRVQRILADSGVAFIINDHVELAAEIGADGVHIGQEDMSAKEARSIIGADAILGLTAFTRTHYDALDPDIINYVGTGPFHATLTKPDKPVLGADGFTQLAKTSPVPVVGIGGITPDNAGDVIAAGAQGIAMMRAVSEAADPAAAARYFVRAVEAAR